MANKVCHAGEGRHPVTDNIDIWITAQIPKNGAGRGNGSANQGLYGVKKLRELILELAVRGKLVPQDPKDEPASILLEKIAKEKARLIKEGKIKKDKPLPEISEDETLFVLPKGWAYTRNGYLFRLRKGKNPKILSEENIGYPYLDIEALDRDNIQRYTNDEKCPRSTDKDILVVCDGSRSGLVLNGKNGVVGSTLAVIDTPSLIQAYVKLLFQEAFQRLNTTMKGAAIPHLDTKNLIIEIIGLPPHKEQLRIVAKVDELMALCDKLEQQQADSNAAHQTLVETLLATLTSVANANEFKEAWQRIADHFDILFTTEQSIDQLKQTILQLAVMGKLVPQDPNDEPASVLLEKIAKEKARLIKERIIKKEKPLPEITENEKIFKLPNGWEWVRLEEMTKKITDGEHLSPPKAIEGVLLLTAKNVLDNGLTTESPQYVSKEDAIKFRLRCDPELGDVLICSRGTIGRCCVVNIMDYFSLMGSVIQVRTFEELNPYYLNILFKSKTGELFITGMTKGMAVNALYLKDIKFSPVPLPPLAEQRRIVAKVDVLMAFCDKLKSRLQEAQTTQIHLADAIVEQAVV